MAEWRSAGPIGVLFDVLNSITSSPQQRELFTKLQQEEAEQLGIPFKPREVIQPVKTRWNSYYSCFERACELQQPIDAYINRKLDEHSVALAARRSRPSQHRPDARKFILEGGLTTSDWATIVEYKQLLEPFKEATNWLQGRGSAGSHGAIWEVYVTFEWLLSALEAHKERLEAINYNDTDAPEDHLVTNVNNAHTKLAQYYELLEESPVYYAATILHPAHKHLLEGLWKVPEDHDEAVDGAHPYKNWLPRNQAAFQELWRLHKIKVAIRKGIQVSPDGPRALKKQKLTSGRAEFLRNSSQIAQRELESTLDDEYEAWRRELPLPDDDELGKQPIKYWLLNRSRYPILAELALDLYAIPASSADCERTFSELGDLLGVRRLHMKPDLLSALQSITSWRRIGLKAS